MPSEFSRQCPVCGQNRAAAYLNKENIRLVQCQTCSMIYANPVPAEFATGVHYDSTGAAYYLSPKKLAGDYAPVRFERELRLFRRHCRAGSVLDVGCSTGAFLFQVRERWPGAYEVLGADVSGPALNYAAARSIPVVRGNFPELDFAGRQFDAVTFWAVLEHLAEPRSFLEKAFTLLKPAGLCFVLVPNMQSLAARLLGAQYRYIYPQHLNYFTRATLTRLACEWFILADREGTHFNPLILWQDWRLGGAAVSNPERAALLEQTTRLKENAWLSPLRPGYKLIEKLLAACGLADNLAFVLKKNQAKSSSSWRG